MTEYVSIDFTAALVVSLEDLDAVEGDAVEAIQREIGHTGVVVMSATADHIEAEEAEEELADALGELTNGYHLDTGEETYGDD